MGKSTYYIVPNPPTYLIIMICMPNTSSLVDDLFSCQTIKITLKNSSIMKPYQGTYKKSASVNGKPSWKSQTKAIWYNQGQLGQSIANNWMIGNRNDTGTRRGFIYTYRMRSGYTHGVW